MFSTTSRLKLERDGEALSGKGTGKDLGNDFGVELERIDLPERQTAVFRHDLGDDVLGQGLAAGTGHLHIHRSRHLDGRHFVLEMHAAALQGFAPGLQHLHALHILLDLDFARLFRSEAVGLDQDVTEKVGGQSRYAHGPWKEVGVGNTFPRGAIRIAVHYYTGISQQAQNKKAPAGA
jgi:hypothetical protein